MNFKVLPRPVLIALTAFLIGGLAFGIYWYLRPDNSNPTPGNEINYGPPTETELDETERHKESLGQNPEGEDEEEESINQNGNKKEVAPIVSFAGQNSDDDIEINGYVPGVIEQDGECEAVLTSGNKIVTETKEAREDAQSTSCGLIVISRAKLNPGNWSLVLNYESSSSSGSSQPMEVSVE